MGGVFAINAGGDTICFIYDDPEPGIERDPRIQNTVIFHGSKKYPELKRFVPPRPPNAQTCSSCNGTGIVPISRPLKYDNFNCYCGGLGWIPG